jgi:hypothetical protein
LLLLFGILVASILLIGVLGFMTSLVLLVGACLVVIDRYSWLKTALASLVIAGACYLIFVAGIMFLGVLVFSLGRKKR